MENTNEVIVIALKNFEVNGMNYVAGSKYALTTEVIATLEEGTVELVATEPTPEVVEETPAVGSEPSTPNEPVEGAQGSDGSEPVVPETPVETIPEETPASEPAPVEPTPEVVEAPKEEPKPWAGNHEVAK